MKRDTNYISRLEEGDRFRNAKGEECVVTKVERDGSIRAATARDGYLRLFEKDGKASTPSSGGDIETP